MYTPVAWEQNASHRVIPEGWEPVRIEMVRKRDGSVSYAIRHDGCCMDHDGMWDYEPCPSSRDDEWLARFRFRLMEGAAAALEKHAPDGRGRFRGEGERPCLTT